MTRRGRLVAGICVTLLLLIVGFLAWRSYSVPRIPRGSRLVGVYVSSGGGRRMPVVKVLELVGQSQRDWQDAVSQAVSEAARRVGNVSGVEVVNWTANVKDGCITEYKANVKVAYLDQQP